MKNHKQISLIDQLVTLIDDSIRHTFVPPSSDRPSPANKFQVDPIQTSEELKKKSASLMRVNHVGEVCAQALYQGQALTSRSVKVKEKMQEAATEEIDHLSWCHDRLEQLDSHTSYLNPIWYMGSLSIGIVAGLAGDKWSLGFLAETENQVVAHLESHLDKLPKEDTVSLAIVTQMREDEAKHAAMAIEEGAATLPEPVKQLMTAASSVMTRLAAHI